MNKNLIQLGLRGITGTFVGASESYLAEFEGECGFRLPDAYREFLKLYGASLFTENCGFRPKVPFPWAISGIQIIDGFYGMSDKPYLDVCEVNKRLRADAITSERQIAIGNDGGSNLVFLSATGEVSFYDRETGRTYPCADDFEGFLNSFEKLP